MIWLDLFVDQLRSEFDIAQATAWVFGLTPDEVVARASDGSSLEVLPDTVRIAFDLAMLHGEFPMRIGYTLRDDETVQRAVDRGDVSLAEQICRSLGVRGLIDDPTRAENPYAALLLGRDHDPIAVTLDPVHADSDEIVIARTVARAIA